MNVQDNDIYLAILYEPFGLTDQYLESNPIKTETSLKVIKTNGESFGQNIYTKKFDDNVPVRITKFILLKDIMNSLNSLYNKQTNSITIEAKIKIID